MTTIIGIQGDGFAVIGADTRITSFDESGMSLGSGTIGGGSSKLATNGNYLLGAAGDVRAINLLHHAFQPPAVPSGLKGKKLDQFITVKFIPALRACFDTHGYSSPENKDNKQHVAEQDSTIVVAVNGILYFIDNDYSWMPDMSGLYAAGSGAQFAIGAIHGIMGGKKLSSVQAKAAALKALAIAAKLDPFSSSPYHTYVQQAPESPASKKS